MAQNNKAKKHHFVSQFYLKAFAVDPGAKDPKLMAFSLDQKKVFGPIVATKLASKMHFNRIELDGYEPDYLEKGLSQFEALASASIRNIEATGKFEGQDRINIINLIALFSVRNPYRRNNWDAQMDHLLKQALSLWIFHY